MQAFDILGARLLVYSVGIITGLAGAWYFVPDYGARGMAFAIIAMNIVMPSLFLFFAIRKLHAENNKPAPFTSRNDP
jgi:O-antigen/teichoic acid export membrane protein